MSVSSAPEFLARARAEASRAGGEPWVFVRELIQNARDAGASRVDVRTSCDAVTDRVVFTDDGRGLTFDGARRYLFRLYSSTKTGAGPAGRFGVGFWTVLRFEPSAVTVRSWPAHGAAWEVTFSPDLARVRRGTPAPRSAGTEVALERPATGAHLSTRVTEAIQRDVRGIDRFGAPGRRLAILVDGRRADRGLELPAPSLSFRRGRIRGSVGLGSTPEVHVFSHGLRVRSAAFLDDLLESPTGARRPPTPSADRLAPRACLEDGRLTPLLSREDVVADRELRRVVDTARRETDRLVERQLDRDRPRSPWRRISDALRRDPPAVAFVAAAALAATALGVAGALHRPVEPPPGRPAELSPVASGAPDAAPPRPAPPARAGAPVAAALDDVEPSYSGPEDGSPEHSFHPLAVRYTPADRDIHLALFVRDDPTRPRPRRPLTPRTPAPVGPDAVHIEAWAAGDGDWLPLPLPTGHAACGPPAWNGSRLRVLETPAGWPGVRLPSGAGRITYATCPRLAVVESPGEAALNRLPGPLRSVARSLRDLPPAERVATAVRSVRERFGTGPTAGTSTAGVPSGRSGDCDVRNGLLVLLLRGAGVPARLAVGHRGRHGSVDPWLHAWAEYALPARGWRVADASEETWTFPAAEPAPSDLAAPESSVHARQDSFRDVGGIAAVPAAALLLVGLVVAARRRTRREVRLDPRPSLLRLLRGALEHPDAFRGAPAVFEHSLLARPAGAPVSLGRAWRAAAQGRLGTALAGGSWARRARQAGFVVLSAGRSECALVAGALGAVDLDAWQSWAETARTTPALQAAASALRRQGVAARLLASPMPAPAPLLDLRRVGWRRALGHGDLVVAVDPRDTWLACAESRLSLAPATTTFAVADRVLDIVGWPGPRRAAVLRPLALAALVERLRP